MAATRAIGKDAQVCKCLRLFRGYAKHPLYDEIT